MIRIGKEREQRIRLSLLGDVLDGRGSKRKGNPVHVTECATAWKSSLDKNNLH